jgi:hypothetical protein
VPVRFVQTSRFHRHDSARVGRLGHAVLHIAAKVLDRRGGHALAAFIKSTERLGTHYHLHLAEQGFVIDHQSIGTFSPDHQCVALGHSQHVRPRAALHLVKHSLSLLTIPVSEYRVMEWALDFESYDDIQHLLAEGTLKRESPAYLIARQAIAIGLASLSTRQRQIYNAIIAPALEGLALKERRGALPIAA